MFAMEMYNLIVMFPKNSLSIYQPVIIGKESPHLFAVFIGYSIKLTFFHLGMMADDFRSYLKMRRTILTGFEIFVCTYAEHLALLRHLKGRVDAYPLITTHLLSIHTAHTRTYDHIGHFIHAQPPEERQCFGRIDRNVRSDYVKLRQ